MQEETELHDGSDLPKLPPITKAKERKNSFRRRSSFMRGAHGADNSHDQSLKSLIIAAGMGVISGNKGVLNSSGNVPQNESQLEPIVPNFVSKQVRRVCYNLIKQMPKLKDSNANDLGLPTLVPTATEAFAAVVMVDVSGYSKLTAVLAERGHVGAELLSKTMKGYLDQIITTILNHGGDIVKFAGDALIFCWKSEKATQLNNAAQDTLRGELVFKASHCCLTLLTKLGIYDIDIEDCPTKTLKIHLGIGAGLIYDVLVGGEPGRWEHFIAGDGVNQLSQVLDLAKAGELALSHHALKWLGCVIDIATLNLGDYDKRCIILTGLEKAQRKAPPAQIDDESDMVELDKKQKEYQIELYKHFIDRSALFKLQADANQCRLFQMDSGILELLSLTELRQVTTIFIKIGSLQVAHRNDILEESQKAISAVQNTLNKCEGSLRQFHVDDKGAVILCFFGLPPLAHENDATLGIKAGIEIREKFSEMFDNFSIGITTGVVSFGGVGAIGRAEYAVMGDSINMAARLMCHQQAANSILCDERTYNLCGTDFHFQSLGETKVKGKNTPISIFQPINSNQERKKKKKKVASDDIADIIGRERERQAITTSLKNMENRESMDRIMIFADSGQVLLPLVSYSKAEATRIGCNVCHTEGVELDQRRQLLPWKSIMDDLLAIVNAGSFSDDEFIVANVISSADDLENSNPTALDDAAKSESAEHEPEQSCNPESVDVSDKPSDVGSQSNVSSATGTLPGRKHSQRPSVNQIVTQMKNRKASLSQLDESDEFLNSALPQGNQSSPTYEVNAPHDFSGYLETISKALVKLRIENVDLTAFDILDAPIENEFYPDANSTIKSHLQGIYTIFEKLINALTASNKIALTFNEAQWFDIRSWELLRHIVINCPNVCIMIFTRLESSFEVKENREILHSIQSQPKVTKLVLEGLSVADTERLIIASWTTGHVIKSISRKIVESIHKKTNGSPYFIKSLATSVRESGQWRVNIHGELTMLNGNYDFEQLSLGYDNQSIILSQFDRLDRNFQLFLKVASVLGQQFLLDDVLYFLTGVAGVYEQIDKKNYSAIIRGVQATDKYGFLIRQSTTSEGAHFQFKSALVRKMIYSMMVLRQRQQLHLHVAQFYELRLTDLNRYKFLLPILDHYKETDSAHLRERIHYIELVANFYYENNKLAECIKYYNELLDITGLYQKDAPSNSKFANDVVANWHRELGHAYFLRGRLLDAEKHSLEALRLFGVAFPETPFQLFYKTYQQSLIRNKKDRALFTNSFDHSEQSFGLIDYSTNYRNYRATSYFSIFLTKRNDPLAQREESTNSSNANLTSTQPPESKHFSVLSTATTKATVHSSSTSGYPQTPAGTGAQANNIGTIHEHEVGHTGAIPLSKISKERNPLLKDAPSTRKDRAKALLHIWLKLTDIYFQTGNFPRFHYCALLGLNSPRIASQEFVNSRFYSFGALMHWILQSDISFTLGHLRECDVLDTRSDIYSSLKISSNQSTLFFLMGQWGKVQDSMISLNHVANAVNDITSKLYGLSLEIAMIEREDITSDYELKVNDYMALAASRDTWLSKFSSAFYALQLAVTQGDVSAIKVRLGLFEEVWKSGNELEKTRWNHFAYAGIVVQARILIGGKCNLVEELTYVNSVASKVHSHEWMHFHGLFELARAVDLAYEKKLLDDAVTRKFISQLCLKLNKVLKKIRCLEFRHGLRKVFKGYSLLLSKSTAHAAVSSWKKGLDDVSEVVFVQKLLQRLISQHSQSNSK